MKIARLSSLLFLLAVSFFSTQDALEAKGKSVVLRPSGKESRMACEWYDVYCNGVWTDECCGSSGSCLNFCDETCGVPAGTCIEL